MTDKRAMFDYDYSSLEMRLWSKLMQDQGGRTAPRTITGRFRSSYIPSPHFVNMFPSPPRLVSLVVEMALDGLGTPRVRYPADRYYVVRPEAAAYKAIRQRSMVEGYRRLYGGSPDGQGEPTC